MRKLIKYLRGYEKESIIGPLFKLLESCFELIVPLIMASIIDVGIKNRDEVHIYKMAGILVFFAVLGLVCALTAQYYAAKAAFGFGTALRNALFAHINTFSYQEIERITTPSLITRLTSDLNQAQSGVNLVLRLFLRAPFIVIGAVIMALTINVRLTLIFLLTIPFICLVLYLVMKYTIPMHKRVQLKLEAVSRSTRENLMGVRVIRAFSRQQEEKMRFDQENQNLNRIAILVGKISALLNPVTYLIVNLAIIALLWFGGESVNVGAITQGELIALINYMSQILIALMALSFLIINYTKASASAERVNELMEFTPSMVEGSVTKTQMEEKIADASNQVEFDKVSFCYSKDTKPALSNLSFIANAGETIGIIGGTGSGKSTLANLIPRFYDATQGEDKVNGVNVADYTYEALRDQIGVVPQKAVLFTGTIRENMLWGKNDATDEEIIMALEIAQAKEFVFAMEGGLDAMVYQGGRNLSGGQRQRLTIARALVKKPLILILDDSSSALDFATDAALRQALKQHLSSTTVFIVSQRAASMLHADKILVLEEGNLVAEGTHKELRTSCSIYQEICELQFGKETKEDEPSK